MKTLKARPSIHLLLILLLVTSSCVPDSLTKFKEDGVTSDESSSTTDDSSTDDEDDYEYVDDDGEPIDPDAIEIPTSLSYEVGKKYIFVTGDADLSNISNENVVTQIKPDGDWGEYAVNYDTVSDEYTVSTSTQNNFLTPVATDPGFNFGSDILTTYASTFVSKSKTGVIGIRNSSVEPIRQHTVDPITFNFYNPSESSEETLVISDTPTISIQAPIPERLTFETDQTFNCTGTDIGTTAPSTPTIGDTYLNGGICYYNYDGTNTNTVAFPYSGPIYISFNLTTNEGFLLNDTTSETFTTDQGAMGTITYKDELGNIYGTLSSGEIYPGDRIDNAFPFSNSEATINKLRYFFQPGSNINLKLINDTADASSTHIGYENTTSITISPDLPSTLRLVKDVDSPLFGYIIDTSGATDHTYQEATEYTVTVENDISTRTFTFDLGIINPPDKLSYSQLLAFKVKNLIQSRSNFTVGQEISTAVVPPYTEGGKGIIKRILDIDGNSKYLIVQVISGNFANTASVDNYETFIDEEAVIQSEPVSLTHLLEFGSGSNTTSYDEATISENPSLCMNFTSDTAQAIVTGNPSSEVPGEFLFINQIKDVDTTTSNRNFESSVTTVSPCDDLLTVYNVESIWSPVMKATFSGDVTSLTLDNAGTTISLVSGMDLLTSTGRANLVVSHVNTDDETALLQSTDGKTITNPTSDTFSVVRPYDFVSNVQFSSVEYLPTFELHRGVDSIIKSTLAVGENVTYTVSPELPTGMSIDPTSGDIYGIPEVAAASKTFTVQATNILGSVSTSFDILIEDYFEVDVKVESTPKFYTHKDGESNFFNKCRIKKRDIISNEKSQTYEVEDVVDIDCYVDIGENDLYYKSLDIEANVGPGICHSIEYRPFSFVKRRPYSTNIEYSSTSNVIVQEVSNASTDCTGAGSRSFDDGISGATNLGTYTTNGVYVNGYPYDGDISDFCAGKYDEYNCDNGRVEYAKIDFNFTPEVLDEDGNVTTPSSCTNTVQNETYDCDGNPRACLQGPIRDELTDTEIEDNKFTSTITSSFAGISLVKTPTHPREKRASTNRYIASYNRGHGCYNSGDTNTEYYSNGIKLHAASASLDSPNSIIDPIQGSQPYYTFNCLDEFENLQGRINIHIRDWDDSFDLDNIDKVTISNMDAGTNLDVFNNFINDTLDWDDYDVTTGGSYSGCSDSSAPTINTTNFSPNGTANGFEGSLEVVVSGNTLPFYHGMDITIGAETYQIKEVDGEDITLTKPLLSDHSGSIVRALFLIPFPAYDWDDSLN